jgi:F-type H+-transporting ATPase subunit gamma
LSDNTGKTQSATKSELTTKSETVIDYEFLPSAQSILEEIVPAAFKAKVFKCFLDAAVSEQIARRVAMKGATDNADEMIGILKQSYTRARQSQITSELAEIIGGAAALE